MIDRLGDFAQNQRMTQLLLGAQTQVRKAQAQISSGKVADRFQDLALDTERLLSTKAVLARTRQFQKNNALVSGRLQVMEESVSSLFELGARLRVLLMQRVSAGSGQPGLVAPEASLMLEQAVSALNVKLDGRFLFAGSRTATAPVALDPAFAGFGGADDTYYQGDRVELTVRADEDLVVPYGMTADRPGFQELIGALRTALAADPADDRAQLEGALRLVEQALSHLSEDRSALGVRQARLDDINHMHSNAEVYLQQRISGIEDVDLAEAVTRMTQDQILLESAMATIAKLSQLSLVDFLR